ncbi:hypothetical protein Tco_0720341 [Tanacetum coccineum]
MQNKFIRSYCGIKECKRGSEMRLKQQKKRQAEVLESAKYYTEEDWDIIRANVLVIGNMWLKGTTLVVPVSIVLEVVGNDTVCSDCYMKEVGFRCWPVEQVDLESVVAFLKLL